MAKNILKEAIADAKAVREVALANAKAALEEAFTPKLQSMLSAKLSETLDEGEDDEEVDLDEIVTYDKDQDTDLDVTENEEVDLESILNELELEEGADADEEVVDEDVEVDEDKEDLDEMEVIYNASTANRAHYEADHVHEGCKNCDKDFDLDTLLEEITNLDKKEIKETKSSKSLNFYRKNLKDTQSTLNLTKTELSQTQKALTKVKSELNEVNLLNSKLLYVNRIFKANNLTDSQKLRVVETFDKSSSVKEAKLIYETIKDTFNVAKSTRKTAPKKSIREGLGMASKAAGTSTAPKKEVIVEANGMIARMQKLANIKINQ